MPLTPAGEPSAMTGENRAEQAARIAGCLSSGWPEMACDRATRPDSSMSTHTATVPPARAALAMGGKLGAGFTSAFLSNTPAQTEPALTGKAPVPPQVSKGVSAGWL